MKPVVAELIWHYLPRTQTFVYGYLRSFTRVQPAVFASELENLDVFPLTDVTFVRPTRHVERAIDKATHWVSGSRRVREARYARAVESRGASVLHGHFGWSCPTGVPLKRDLGVPLITTFYGQDMSASPSLPEWRAEYDRLFEEGDVFLVEGSHMRRQLADLGCPAERIAIQHIGVDVTQADFAARTPPDGSPITVLMCSSFVEKKGLPYGIEAFAKVRTQRTDVRLVVAGDGPGRADIERLIDELGIREDVELVGFVNHSRFFELARDAAIFMAPSITASNGDSEGGAPTVLLEAQACGLPVLSTLHADIPEVVLDSVSGYLVPERDVDSLAERLAYLLDHSETWAEMGLAGRRHVEDSYDLSDQARRLEDLYLRVAN